MSTAYRLACAVRQLLVALAAVVARLFGGSGVSSGLRALMVVVLSTGAVLALGGGVASAKITRLVQGSFNASESPGGAFTAGPWGLAVDNSAGASAGDIYVGETSLFTGESRVVKVKADGTYAGVEFNGSATPAGSFAFLNTEAGYRRSGLAVDSSTGANSGDVYVADDVHNVIDRFSETGTYQCQITGAATASASECAGATGSKTPAGGFSPTGIAVNKANGDIYVSDADHTVIDEFNSGGEYIGQIADSHLTSPTALALDSSGDVYVDNGALFSGESVVEFDSSGSFVSTIDSKGPNALAADAASGHVLVYDNEGEQIAEYESTGALAGVFGHQYSYTALAANESANLVYITNINFEGSTVDIYGPPVIIPDATAASATEVKQFTATLNGEVGPAGGANVESCEFEYGTTASYGQAVPCSPATPYASATNVSASVSALSPETTYHFRVKASNSNGIASYSSDQTFTTPALAVTGQATNVAGKSAKLNGTVEPDGTTITDCHFEYGTTTRYGQTANCSPSTPYSATTAISAEITGLAENTIYHFRLVTANSGATYTGSDETFTTLSRPVIDAAYTASVTPNSVDLNAQINPKGFDTTYHFEWGTEAGDYTHTEPTTDIGSGTSDMPASQHVSGLSANTTYHWRVVATNSIGTTDGQDRTFIYDTTTPSGVGCPNTQLRIGYSSYLPDCRAYEQVSPVDKNGNDIHHSGGGEGYRQQQAAVDGNGVFYEADGPLPGSQSGVENNQYLSSRTASGWSTRAVGLPQPGSLYPGCGFQHNDYYLPFSPDLSTGVLTHAGPPLVPGAPENFWNLYVGQPATGSYQLVTTVTPPNSNDGNQTDGSQQCTFGYEFQGVSTDFSHVIFAANDALTPEAPYPATNLYEWVGGQLRLVGLIPSSGTSCTGAACVPANGSEAGDSHEYHRSQAHAISADGSRIVFSTGSECCERHIYDRLNGTTTVDVSASQRTPPEPGITSAHYEDASVDGSHVLFTSEGALTNAAAPGSGVNLYNYDVDTGQLTDLTAASDVRVKGLVGLSEDASYVYFVAEGVLASNSNSHGDTAHAGQPNLYLWHGGQTTFIATLAPPTGYNQADFLDWDHAEGQTVRVTPDGVHLAFESQASLTGYDNTPRNQNPSFYSECAFEGQVYEHELISRPCREVYLYDATANRLNCVSCNPTGERPAGDSEIESVGSRFYAPRNLSPDGGRLFFTTRDALLPSDTNELYDVYEWEADGSGSCQSSAENGGCLYLISGARGGASSYFADASPSGNDIFFTTGARLVGQDEDEFIDLYDARVDGGLASQNEPIARPACTSLEGCRSPLSELPAELAAASAELHGAGNLATQPEKPEEDQINKHHKKHAKKHHKKRHRKYHHKHRAANNHRRGRR